jgi:hypothetical protein
MGASASPSISTLSWMHRTMSRSQRPYSWEQSWRLRCSQRDLRSFQFWPGCKNEHTDLTTIGVESRSRQMEGMNNTPANTKHNSRQWCIERIIGPHTWDKSAELTRAVIVRFWDGGKWTWPPCLVRRFRGRCEMGSFLIVNARRIPSQRRREFEGPLKKSHCIRARVSKQLSLHRTLPKDNWLSKCSIPSLSR